MTLPLDPDPIIGATYTDLNTGCIYELDQDFASPTYGQYIEVYCPPAGGGGGTPPDTTPPSVPVIKSTATQADQQDDGTSVVGISAVIGYATPPAGLTDLGEIVMQSTRFELTPGAPDWGRATQWATASTDATGTLDTTVVVPGVQAATTYWLRAAARDKGGYVSGWSAIASLDSAADLDGPPPPQNIVTTPGNTTFAVRWDPIEIADLSYVEVQWRVASPVGNWTTVRVPGTITVIAGAVNDTVYNVRLRSVDTSGNVQTGAVDGSGNPISGKASDDTIGWVSAPNVTPTGIPASSVVWTDADIANLFAGKINADWIDAGTLKVGVGAGNAAGIEVYDSAGRLVGRWTPAGIEIVDTDATTNFKLLITESSLTIKDYTDPANPVAVVTINPLGIDAASITFGSARGGHNMVQNSSFEMGSFVASVNTPNVWDVTADFSATRLGADTNITTGASTLTMTAI